MRPPATLLLVVAAICVAQAKQDDKAIIADIKKYDLCVQRSLYSFLSPDFYPPRNMDEFVAKCKRHAEAFKCVKENTKGATPLVRRGLVTMINSRQRLNRRLCANPDSDYTKRFVAMSGCIMDRRFAAYMANDNGLVRQLRNIYRRDFNDSSAELKQFCCTFHHYKQGFHANLGDECAKHKDLANELRLFFVTEDMTIICEDEERLAVVCPKLAPLVVDESRPVPDGLSPAGTGIYLIATLGETHGA